MAFLVETPDQELQIMIGRLIWENTALRHRVQELEQAAQSPSGPARQARESEDDDHLR